MKSGITRFTSAITGRKLGVPRFWTPSGPKLDSMSQVSASPQKSPSSSARRKPNCQQPRNFSELSSVSRGLLQFGYRLGGGGRLRWFEQDPRWSLRQGRDFLAIGGVVEEHDLTEVVKSCPLFLEFLPNTIRRQQPISPFFRTFHQPTAFCSNIRIFAPSK